MLMIEEWMLQAQPDDLPDFHRQFAKKVGVQAALELAALYGGRTYYVPKLDESLRQTRDKQIRAEYTGYNIKELSMKYNLSDTRIRSIIGYDDPNQLKLFEGDGL